MGKKVLRLWMLLASNERYGEMHEIYARDEEDARDQAEGWLRERPDLSLHELSAYPNGFTIHQGMLPGMIEVEE
jgi:hypothetical protein